MPHIIIRYVTEDEVEELIDNLLEDFGVLADRIEEGEIV